MDVFLTRRWDTILPGCSGTSALARGAALAARWLHEPQSISNQFVGELSTPRGAVSTRAISLSSPGCWSCGNMGDFSSGDKTLSPPGACGGTSTLAKGATLAARWFHEPHPISNQQVGLGFPHPAGRH